jgi:uncharacterized protein
MSQENVEVVRRAFEAHQRGDSDAVFALYDRWIEIEDDPSVPWPARYRGFDGVRDFFRDRMAICPGDYAEVEEWIDAGDEVIALMHFRAHGRRSGVPLDFRQAHVWTVKDGKLTRLRIYQSKAEALEAVGLRE